MRFAPVLGAAVLTALLSMPSTDAKAETYCLIGDRDVCGFASMQQCLASMAGLANFCVVDINDQGRTIPRSRKR